MHEFLDHVGPIPFAHRGGAGVHPENSLAAFAHAVSLGYRYLETDAHLTADGVVVAFHDDRLDRVTDRIGAISELTWAEVSEARIAGSEPVPLMEELLTTWPDVRINIDPKHDEVVDALAALLQRLGAVERVCIGSFSDRRIERLRALLGPGLCTSMGPKAIARLRASSFGLGRSAPEGACVQVPESTRGVPLVDRRFLDRCHDLGLPVHVWTVDDADDMARLLDLGIDGLMTDEPGVLRTVLLGRGQWSAR